MKIIINWSRLLISFSYLRMHYGLRFILGMARRNSILFLKNLNGILDNSNIQSQEWLYCIFRDDSTKKVFLNKPRMFIRLSVSGTFDIEPYKSGRKARFTSLDLAIFSFKRCYGKDEPPVFELGIV